MMIPTVFIHNFLIAALCIMTVIAFVCLVRAIKGPRITDRVVALNMIGTLVVMMICILSYLMQRTNLLDE